MPSAGAAWRSRLRLYSALTMLTFVLCHLTNHALALVSLAWANGGHAVLVAPWRTDAGTILLLGAALTHYTNALWSVFIRRSLRLRGWEGWQLGLGLTIPALLMLHVMGTRVAEEVLRTTPDYYAMLVLMWVLAPWTGWLQAATVLTIWTHACIGIRFWLGSKTGFPRWRTGLLVTAVLVPTLALAGFVAAGSQIARQAAADEDFAADILDDANMTAATGAAVLRLTVWGIAVHCGLVLLPFAARAARRWRHRTRRGVRLTHSCGRTVPVPSGATVLEALRESGIGHASVCGGRGRCTTCRIHVVSSQAPLPAPNTLEARALARLHAPATTRLACQVRPVADLSIRPLLPPEARLDDGYVPGGLEGREQQVAVMFTDLRGSTSLGEAKLPYDVLFILNQFFQEMNQALVQSGGHYSQFTGDGLMALYGLDGEPPAKAVRNALAGAADMLARLDGLNTRLAAELPHPLVMGIGIHFGEAIVGRMGPPNSQIVSAIGDTVNTAARLESLTKDYGCPLILSAVAAHAAGLRLPEDTRHAVVVKGRSQSVGFHVLTAVPTP